MILSSFVSKSSRQVLHHHPIRNSIIISWTRFPISSNTASSFWCWTRLDLVQYCIITALNIASSSHQMHHHCMMSLWNIRFRYQRFLYHHRLLKWVTTNLSNRSLLTLPIGSNEFVQSVSTNVSDLAARIHACKAKPRTRIFSMIDWAIAGMREGSGSCSWISRSILTCLQTDQNPGFSVGGSFHRLTEKLEKWSGQARSPQISSIIQRRLRGNLNESIFSTGQIVTSNKHRRAHTSGIFIQTCNVSAVKDRKITQQVH